MNKRSPYDFYPTPEGAVEAFIEADKKNWINKTTYCVLEPSAGDGNIVKVLKKYLDKIDIVANEIDNTHTE